MQFRAAIKDQTLIHRVWSGERRSIGLVDGVRFRRLGLRYISEDDPLPADAVAVLSHNPQVQLEMSGPPVAGADSQPPSESEEEPGPVKPVAAQPAPAATPTSQQQRPAKVDLRAPQKGWNGGKNR